MNRYTLVIFDMDGTLTEERLDFEAIRREMGVAEGVGILEHLASLSEEEEKRAREILDRHEWASAESCGVHEGAVELLEALKRMGVATALLTRNSSRCAARILSRHALTLDHVATREDRPHKPHKDSILNVTRRFSRAAEETLMVGDYVYDVQAARNAGCDSALVCLRDGGKRPAFAGLATYCVERLMDIVPLVEDGKNG